MEWFTDINLKPNTAELEGRKEGGKAVLQLHFQYSASQFQTHLGNYVVGNFFFARFLITLADHLALMPHNVHFFILNLWKLKGLSINHYNVAWC